MEKAVNFSLKNEGDSACVRILHTNTSTIEVFPVHTVQVGERYSTIKCCGENCPLCEKGEKAYDRAFIHLFDYTDNTEKMWVRTPSILSQLEDVANSWGKLSDCVIKISRGANRGKYPNYSIMVVNANQYAPVESSLIDQKLAYRFHSTRSVDELKEFVRTGVMPAHTKKEFIPREEYAKKSANNKSENVPKSVNNTTPSVTGGAPIDDDPFSFIR